MFKMSELKERDVVDVADGRRIGMVGDLEIDPDGGRVVALLVPGPPRFLGMFGTDGELRVPWTDIVKIGQDVILVRLTGAPAREG